MGDVAGVAVEQQHGSPWLRRRDEPGMQAFPVAGVEPHLFILEARTPWRRGGLAAYLGEVDQPRLKQEHADEQRRIGGCQHS
ncbi:MAG: hypothetical protein HY028_04925 [Gammaproteobacteria bacterium]|nr:hypothetical protein [Gammaproteobacteria bacterium]